MDTLTKSCSATIVITANGEVQTHEEATVYVKELDIFLTMKVPENTPAVLSLGKLCDENGYSYEWIHGQKPHLIKNGIRIPCNTENFVPMVVPGLSSSSSPSRQENHYSTSSSTSSSSPTASEIQIRERKMGLIMTPLQYKCQLQLMIDQGNLMKPRSNGATRCILRSRSGCKNSGKIWWMMKFQYTEILTPVLLMRHLQSPHSRDVRICVSTVFILISLKTEIARSVRGPK